MTLTQMKRVHQGFTLIEVLVSLLIVAIALAAIIKMTSSNISNTGRVKKRTISHMVQMHAINLIQLNLIPHNQYQISQATTMFKQKWYWRANVDKTADNHIKKLTILISDNSSGPFDHPLTAYYYQS